MSGRRKIIYLVQDRGGIWAQIHVTVSHDTPCSASLLSQSVHRQATAIYCLETNEWVKFRWPPEEKARTLETILDTFSWDLIPVADRFLVNGTIDYRDLNGFHLERVPSESPSL